MRQAERQAERFSGLSQEREGEEFLGAIEAPGREGASRRSRRSRGGGRERFRADGETLDDLSSETESIERANAELERQREEREAATMAELERKREATLEQHEFEMELLQELQDKEKEGFETRRQAEEDALDKAKDAIRQREQAEREFAAEASGAINQIASAYITAFQEAIEGQKSLEDAMLDATKAILRSIGEELVARGIGKILEGIASIPSPTAATMIGGGTAMVAFGVGLGAASAAIPSSQGAEAEEPRQDPDDSDSDESREITVVFGNPVLTAGTQAQLARGMGRALRGDRTIPGSVGG
jgi:hypothetical protein